MQEIIGEKNNENEQSKKKKKKKIKKNFIKKIKKK